MADVAGISSEMSQLIRLKERELHEVQDMRYNALEKLVEERDHVNAELSRRFDQLKEDFSYNLTLLEARDQEIERLEGNLKEKSTSLEDSEAERRTLVTRIEVLELRESEREEKHLAERNNSKRILQELRDAIESMKWAASEESKTKQRQIDVLREDNRVLASSREESLESQRRDLTTTFEQLILHREKHYGAREKKLGAQILALDEKFETLNTENSRLKSELQGSQRVVESQQKDLLQDKEKLQGVQWQLEDERSNKQRLCDALERQVQSLNAEVDALKDSAEEQAATLTGQLEAAQTEAEREKEFRMTLEKRLGEYRDSSKSNLHHLEAELLAKSGTESKLKTEILRLTGERERLLESLEMCRQELTTSQRAAEDAREEASSTANALSKTRQELQHSQTVIDVKEAEVKVAGKTACDREQALAETVAAAEERVGAAVEELRGREDGDKELLARAEEAEALLKEEREEVEGLKLRLRLQESQMHALRADASTSVAASASPSGPAASSTVAGTPAAAGTGGVIAARGAQKGLGLSAGLAEASSPIFSEDYGPVSLPTSPQATPNPQNLLASSADSGNSGNSGFGLGTGMGGLGASPSACASPSPAHALCLRGHECGSGSRGRGGAGPGAHRGERPAQEGHSGDEERRGGVAAAGTQPDTRRRRVCPCRRCCCWAGSEWRGIRRDEVTSRKDRGGGGAPESGEKDVNGHRQRVAQRTEPGVDGSRWWWWWRHGWDWTGGAAWHDHLATHAAGGAVRGAGAASPCPRWPYVL